MIEPEESSGDDAGEAEEVNKPVETQEEKVNPESDVGSGE